MKDITFQNGYASEYEDFTMWVETFKVGATATKISKNENGKYVVENGVITAVVGQYRDFDGDTDKYSDACEDLLGDGDATCEFITNDDNVYVVIECNGPTITTDKVIYNNVGYC